MISGGAWIPNSEACLPLKFWCTCPPLWPCGWGLTDGYITSLARLCRTLLFFCCCFCCFFVFFFDIGYFSEGGSSRVWAARGLSWAVQLQYFGALKKWWGISPPFRKCEVQEEEKVRDKALLAILKHVIMCLSSNSLTTSADQNIEGHTVSHMVEEGGRAHYVKNK